MPRRNDYISSLVVEQEEERSNLRRDLREAQDAVITQLAQDLRDTFERSSYPPSEASHRDANIRLEEFIDLIISKAVPHADHWFGSKRADCPLCGATGSGFYQHQTGYAIPAGLTQHLKGDRATPCKIFRVLQTIFYNRWRPRIEHTELTAQRREHELLYVIDPNRAPVLGDEALAQGTQPRGTYDLSKAEERLESLGFKILNNNQTKTYLDDREDCFVYGDPRGSGLIKFLVIVKQLPTPSDTPQHLTASFEMTDRVTKNFVEKYSRLVSLQVQEIRYKQSKA